MSSRAQHLPALEGHERVIRPPDPRIEGVLHRPLVGYRHAQTRASTWLEPPRPQLSLIIDIEGELTADGRRLPEAWLGGLAPAAASVGVGPVYAGIDLKLVPLGAYALAGRPLSELEQGTIALEDLFGRAARELLCGLHAAPDWDARFDLVEGFLADRLQAGSPADPIVAWAWRRLVETAGRIRVQALVDEIGCSRRHLLTRFHAQVGIAPKVAARILRFHDVCRRIERRPAAWADIAVDAGYADQSHLNREFRALAGVTPTEFLARLPPGANLPPP